MNVCVIPTNRPEALLKWMEEWREISDWDHLIVVFDGLASDAPNIAGDDIEVWSWDNIDAELGENSWIISRRDSAIRCFGFYRAWKLGAEYIGTLDDDCLPYNTPWFQSHIDNMEIQRWRSSIKGLRVRGLPYHNLGSYRAVLNMGLWGGDPDLDAVCRLANPESNYWPEVEEEIIPVGQFWSLCGMNLCFHRDFTPAMYFPLMGEGQPYRRFDDIWCGVIAKRIADHLGMAWTVGSPLIEHRRLSMSMKSLVDESPGIVANEEFWEWIMRAKIEGDTVSESMACLANQLGTKSEPAISAEYKMNLVRAMDTWAGLFV